MTVAIGVFVETERTKLAHCYHWQRPSARILERNDDANVKNARWHRVFRNGAGNIVAVASLRDKGDGFHPEGIRQFVLIDAFLFHQDFEAPVPADGVHQATDGTPLKLHIEALVGLDETGNGIVAFPAATVVVAFPKANGGAALDFKGIGVGQFFFEEELSRN